MIIEIKGLPSGRQVKHINVDITFEDGNPVIKTNVTEKNLVNSSDENNQHAFPDTDSIHENKPIEMPTIPETRDKKEVPPEMTDMEF